LECLQQRINEWDTNPKIGDIFATKGKFLKLYNNYVSQHTTSMQTIDRLVEKNQNFAYFMRIKETTEKTELKSLLGEPLTRIAFYSLKLDEFLQYTRKGTPDYDELQKVVHNLKEMNDSYLAKSIGGIHGTDKKRDSIGKSSTLQKRTSADDKASRRKSVLVRGYFGSH